VSEDCWYTLASDALGDIGAPFDFDAGDGWTGTGRRLATGEARTASMESDTDAGISEAALPDWAREPAPDEPAPPIPLAPSRPYEDEPAVRSPLGQDGGARFQRGLLIHRLLQTLPELAPGERADACRRFLSQPTHGLDGAAQTEIAAETLAVLDAPEFAPLFGPGSLAETSIAGIVGEQAIAGQVDRLLVTDDSVTIIDFKSNRPPPASPAEVAALYLRQMAAYRAVLREIYPNRPVLCALLWTDGPTLMHLDDAAMDRYAP
jgi:ATP-dependent helicase/nuclease subunit A